MTPEKRRGRETDAIFGLQRSGIFPPLLPLTPTLHSSEYPAAGFQQTPGLRHRVEARWPTFRDRQARTRGTDIIHIPLSVAAMTQLLTSLQPQHPGSWLRRLLAHGQSITLPLSRGCRVLPQTS
jgi:hypothetical protein